MNTFMENASEKKNGEDQIEAAYKAVVMAS